MFLARFRIGKGAASLPIDRASLVEGMRINGFDVEKSIRAMNNLSRGIPVIVGECVIERINRSNQKWN
jgi:hypothetical protein